MTDHTHEHDHADHGPDPRDLPGIFRHHVDVAVRFADTDAMGHVNNAKYLTYCEIARIRYWTDITGMPIALGTEDAESLILAEARITYRAPVFHGEIVTIQTRAVRIGRSSFTLEHRLLATIARRRPATRRGQRIDPRPLRLRGGGLRRPVGRACRRDRGLRGRRSAQASVTDARKIATAFWPPKPKPSTATVSTFALRAVSGT